VSPGRAEGLLRIINGLVTTEKPVLIATRCYTLSPFEAEKNVIYFGGSDGNHKPSLNRAWIFKTSLENALREDVTKPEKLTK